MSWNLLEYFDFVVDICVELFLLRSFKVNWNCFCNVFEDKKFERVGDVFEGVKELVFEDMLFIWYEICYIVV